ncbi:hypothetical protein [Neoaquamicrobium sediminum]|uniref:hypothetical protein n=1 Tax=Neoaquamicrobium sediminum TaxID=1849104 RepID=UPI0040353033
MTKESDVAYSWEYVCVVATTCLIDGSIEVEVEIITGQNHGTRCLTTISGDLSSPTFHGFLSALCRLTGVTEIKKNTNELHYVPFKAWVSSNEIDWEVTYDENTFSPPPQTVLSWAESREAAAKRNVRREQLGLSVAQTLESLFSAAIRFNSNPQTQFKAAKEVLKIGVAGGFFETEVQQAAESIKILAGATDNINPNRHVGPIQLQAAQYILASIKKGTWPLV